MPFHYPSFSKHLSFSKRDKRKLIRNRVRTDTTKTVYCIIEIRNLARKFGTHVEDSFLDGMYQNLSF